MLQFIREKTQGVITWIIIAVICVSFAMFGISNYFVSGGGEDKIAEVDGKSISLASFKQSYQQLVQQQQISGQDLSESDQQKIREIASQQLIQMTILVQAAEKQGFLITDKEILDLLAQIPELQQEGKYDPERLQHMLYSIGMTQSQFFQTIRQKLLISQVQESLYESSFVLPREVMAYNSLYHQTRDLQYVVIASSTFMDSASSAKFDENNLESYYQAHIADYQEPATVQLSYVLLPSKDKDFASKSDQLANLSYESPDSLDEVSTTLNLPIKTTGFITAAGDSTHPITSNADVLRVAFTDDLIRDKYNSDVISLASGDLIVVRVANYKPAQPKPLSAVKANIVQELTLREAQKQAYLAGQTLLESASKGASLAQLAQQNDAKHYTQQRVSRIADDVNQQILQNLFALPNENLPQRKVIQLSNGNVVVMQLDRINEAASTLSAEQQTQLTQQLMDDFGKIDYELYRLAVSNTMKVKRYPLPGNVGDV